MDYKSPEPCYYYYFVLFIGLLECVCVMLHDRTWNKFMIEDGKLMFRLCKDRRETDVHFLWKMLWQHKQVLDLMVL